MSDIAINQVLSQMRAMQAMARNESPTSLETKAAAPFSELMSQPLLKLTTRCRTPRRLLLDSRRVIRRSR